MKKINIFLLALFIVLGAVLNFLPHLNYPYPMHVDEWVHFQYSNSLSSNSPLYFGYVTGSNLEEGFHILLSVLNLNGADYMFMFNFFPSLILIFICLGVFILTRKMFGELAGVFSVLFIVLLNSTVMILGPVFLVPMNIGMFFIALGIYLIKIESKAWFLVLSSLLIIHPPTAMAFLLLINIEFVVLRKDFIKNILYEGLGILIAIPLYIPIFLNKGAGTINYLSFVVMPGLVFIPNFIGWFLTSLVLIGIYFSLIKNKYSIALEVLALLFFIFIFYHYEIEFFIPYRRALMYLFLIFSMAFGLGCSEIIDFFKPKNFRLLVLVIIIGLILFFTIPSKLDSNNYFYHIITEEDYGAFKWIRENTINLSGVAVIDPWKANAFTPVAGKEVYSRITQGPDPKYEARNNEINAFFSDKCKDIDFLKRNNITLIYGYCENKDLKEVYKNVYVVG